MEEEWTLLLDGGRGLLEKKKKESWEGTRAQALNI